MSIEERGTKWMKVVLVGTLALGAAGLLYTRFGEPKPTAPQVIESPAAMDSTRGTRPLDPDFQRAMKLDSERAAHAH